jgi:predicted membrane chloride channel (bestrophin family)
VRYKRSLRNKVANVLALGSIGLGACMLVLLAVAVRLAFIGAVVYAIVWAARHAWGV